MAINFHEKYSSKVQERFFQESLTQSSFSKDLDTEFTGVKTVKVTEVHTVPMNDYNRTKNGNRYGDPTELQDSVQEFTMTQDRSFSFTVDKGNNSEQQGVKNAGKAMSRQMREVVTPEIDRYRFKKWAAGAGQGIGMTAAPTKDTIYTDLLTAKIALDNKLVPKDGRTVYLGSVAYLALMECDKYIRLEKLGSKAIVKGKIGEIFDMDIKPVPDSYLPAGVYFMVVSKKAAISPVKLHECKMHMDPPGLSGHLVEGRFIYDAFVKGTMMDGIYVAAEADKKVKDPTVTLSDGSATVSVTSGVAYYTLDGSDPRYSTSRVQYSAAVPVAEGEKIRVVAVKDDCFMSGIVEAAGTAAA